MSYDNKSISKLLNEAHETAINKGWWDNPKSFLESIALVHSELSEAVESWRNYEPIYSLRPDGKPDGYGVELADAVIRIFDMCAYFDIDLESLIRQKMDYNKTREFRHGGKRA